jgi:hypothetical protein
MGATETPWLARNTAGHNVDLSLVGTEADLMHITFYQRPTFRRLTPRITLFVGIFRDI